MPEITTRETKLVAEVLNDGLTTDDTLQIKYYFDGPTDVLLWTDCNPHTLEIYENDQWNSLEYSEDVNFYAGMSRISEEAFALKIPLSQSYTNVKPGHYKYTQPLYIDGSEKPFGESIFVEFDVTYPEFYVEGKVKNNQIKSTNDLEIIYTIVTESEAEYTYDEHPYNLYKYDEYDYWKKCKLIPDILLTDRVYKTITGNSVINITIPLKEYFGTLSPGKYKYVHEIAGKRVGVVFEIGN